MNKHNSTPKHCNFVFDKWPALPPFEASVQSVRGSRLIIGPIERMARKLFQLSMNKDDWTQPFIVRVDVVSLKAEGITEGQVKALIEVLKLSIYLFHFGRAKVKGYSRGVEVISQGYMTLPTPNFPSINI